MKDTLGCSMDICLRGLGALDFNVHIIVHDCMLCYKIITQGSTEKV